MAASCRKVDGASPAVGNLIAPKLRRQPDQIHHCARPPAPSVVPPGLQPPDPPATVTSTPLQTRTRSERYVLPVHKEQMVAEMDPNYESQMLIIWSWIQGFDEFSTWAESTWS